MLKNILLACLMLVVGLAISNAALADANIKADIANYSERLRVVVFETCPDNGCWLTGFSQDKDGRFLVFLDFEGTFEGEVNPLCDTLKAECDKKHEHRQTFTFAVKPRLTVREVLNSDKVRCECKKKALRWMAELFCVRTFYVESYYKFVFVNVK